MLIVVEGGVLVHTSVEVVHEFVLVLLVEWAVVVVGASVVVGCFCATKLRYR